MQVDAHIDGKRDVEVVVVGKGGVIKMKIRKGLRGYYITNGSKTYLTTYANKKLAQRGKKIMEAWFKKNR